MASCRPLHVRGGVLVLAEAPARPPGSPGKLRARAHAGEHHQPVWWTGGASSLLLQSCHASPLLCAFLIDRSVPVQRPAASAFGATRTDLFDHDSAARRDTCQCQTSSVQGRGILAKFARTNFLLQISDQVPCSLTSRNRNLVPLTNGMALRDD